MTRRFGVRTVPRFDRLFRHLSGRHPELAAVYAKALDILEVDPHNASRTHPIRKLEGVLRDEGGLCLLFTPSALSALTFGRSDR